MKSVTSARKELKGYLGVFLAISLVALSFAPFTAGAVPPPPPPPANVQVDLINGHVPDGFCIAGPITIDGSGITGTNGGKYSVDIGWGIGSPATTTVDLNSGGNIGAHTQFAFSAGPHLVGSALTLFLHHSTATGNDEHTTIVNLCTAPPTQGVVVLAKQVVNNGVGSAQPQNFTLHINGNNIVGSSTGAVPGVLLDSGTYTITEDPLAGYEQSNFSCTVNGNATTTTSNPNTIQVFAGKNYFCTITNSYNPLLDQTITFGPLTDKTYGDSDFSVSATSTSGLPITFTSRTPDICTVVGQTVTLVAAGECTIEASQAGNEIYSPAPDVDQSFTVAKKVVTPGLTGDVTKVYDGTTNATLAPGNYTLDGVVGGDVVTLNDPAAGSYDTKNVGTGKTVSASGLAISGADSTNYQLSGTSVSAAIGTITEAGLTVTADNASKVFGQFDPTLTYHITSGTLFGGDSLLGAIVRAIGEAVGTYEIGQGTLDAGTNYVMSFVPGTFTIIGAEAIVTIGDQNADYDGNPHSATVTTNPEGLTCDVTYNGSSVVPTNAGTYNVVANCHDEGDNTTGSGSGTLTIHKVDASCSVNGYSVTYDATEHTASGSCTGALGETLSGLDLTGTAHTNAGGFLDDWTFTDSTGNYNNQSGSVADTINKANPNCSIDGFVGAYDGNAHGASGSCLGVSDETLGDLDLGSSFTDVPGGTAHWVFTDTTGNYTDASGDAEIIIANGEVPATLHIVKNVGEGDPDATFTFHITGESDTTVTTSNGTGETTIHPAAGTISVTEASSGGWTLSGSSCSNEDEPGSLTLNSGVEVTCTFNNYASGADLGITKSIDDTTLDVGQTITYTLTVVNHGPAAASGVTVTDLFPTTTLTYVSDDSTTTSTSYATSTSIWSIGSLSNGEQKVLHITATVQNGTEGKTIVNSASVSASENDDYTDNNDSASVSATVNTPDNGGGGEEGNGGGGGGGGNGPIFTGSFGGGSVLGASTGPGQVLGVSTEECSTYLTSFIKFGANNDSDQVMRLERFLRDLAGFSSITETGTYNQADLDAVHAFQRQYADRILTPWGATRSTGFVYLTTRKTINEIVCKFAKEFPLTADQQAEIDRVKALGEAFNANLPTTSGTPAPKGNEGVPATQGTPDVGVTTGTSQSAGAASAPSTGGFWHGIGNFFRSLF